MAMAGLKLYLFFCFIFILNLQILIPFAILPNSNSKQSV
ncbi:hypothetical protein Cabys_3558 [Caldithrix abyssi DSM 13497]|uniref:Uncharacterized protein n=1 Tax=Caldithrix abyssi DSM 13497 TaxID=880073 RepID=A0A1J1CEI2_CALAY|nr:hypothetical protein Cabys_3558 [Caldithrix abyssi DSM 13497]